MPKKMEIIRTRKQAKTKTIVTRSLSFSPVLRQLHVITLSFDWFTVMSVSFVIG